MPGLKKKVVILRMYLLGLTENRGCDGGLEGASSVLGVVWKDFSYLPTACVDLAVRAQSAPLTRVLGKPNTLPLDSASCKWAQQLPSTR